MVKHRSLAVLAALLLTVGALPASSAAQVQLPVCSLTTQYSVPTAATFTLPPNTLAVIRGLPGYPQVVFRVPLGVQASVVGGWGTYWVYDQWTCSENQLEGLARDYAWRHGLVVADVYSLQGVTVVAVGYYPVPVVPVPVPSPYVPIVPIPQPVPVTPSFPSFPYQPAPWMPQPCGPLNYTTVSPELGRVYGAAVVRATFDDYQLKVVLPVSGEQTAFVREAKTIEVVEAPGCGSEVVGGVANSLVAQGGSVSHSNAPSWIQNRFSLIRR